MKLHLANSTTKNIVFFYRDPITKLLHNAELGSGRQVVVGNKNWTQAHVESVVKQVEMAGGHDAAEVHGRLKGFHGLLYRVDGVIESDEIKVGHGHVKKMQNDRSVDQAVKAVLATDRAANPDRGHRRTKETVVEVEQIVPPGQRPTGDETKFTLSVDSEGGAAKLINESVGNA